MTISEFIHRAFFAIEHKFISPLASSLRKLKLKTAGMSIGAKTRIPSIYVSWPHKVSIGKECKLEKGIRFKFDGLWSNGVSITIEDNVFLGSYCEFNITENIYIGKDSLIASGCRFIDHDHSIILGQKIGSKGKSSPIKIEENAWLGCNVVVLKGIIIGAGSIVAAGSIVTKSIPPNEIWGGAPAKKIGVRTY